LKEKKICGKGENQASFRMKGGSYEIGNESLEKKKKKKRANSLGGVFKGKRGEIIQLRTSGCRGGCELYRKSWMEKKKKKKRFRQPRGKRGAQKKEREKQTPGGKPRG